MGNKGEQQEGFLKLNRQLQADCCQSETRTTLVAHFLSVHFRRFFNMENEAKSWVGIGMEHGWRHKRSCPAANGRMDGWAHHDHCIGVLFFL